MISQDLLTEDEAKHVKEIISTNCSHADDYASDPDEYKKWMELNISILRKLGFESEANSTEVEMIDWLDKYS
jgi:hypothetical protein